MVTSMLKCKELSRLPKSPSGKYVTFRRQTPGCTAEQFRFGSSPRPDYLDPSHPATSVPKNLFPHIRSDILGIRAVPFAVLTKPEHIWTAPPRPPIETWTERVKLLLSTNANPATGEEPLDVAPILVTTAKENAIPMSFVNATSKKRTSNKRHIRGKIASRLKLAINLIVARGADVVEVNGKPKLIMNEKEAEEMPQKWVSPGWTYIFFPTLEIYRMPYHDLIPLLRKSLQRIYDLSQNFERKWASSAMAPRKASYTQQHSHYAPIRGHAPHHKTAPRKPFQQRTPTQTPYRAYSTRNDPRFPQDGFEARTSREWNSDASKKHTEVLKKPPQPLSHEFHETFTPAPVRHGDVAFKRTLPISRHSRMPENNLSATRKNEDIKMLKDLRDHAKQLFEMADQLRAQKRKREFIRRRIARREAKRGESLGLDFIGLDSLPNASSNPFTNAEPISKPEKGPTPTLKALLDASSALTSPRKLKWRALVEAFDPALSDYLSEYPRVELPGVDDFDPFAPLVHEKTPASAESADNSSTGSSGSLDIDDFAPLEPTPTPHTPEAELTPLNVSPGETPSVENLVQPFDPSHPEDSDDSLITTTTIHPVSQPTSGPGSPPPHDEPHTRTAEGNHP